MAFALLSRQTNINFAGFRRVAYAISALFLAVGIFAIILNGGLRYGVDFAGGAMVQIQFERPIADEQVKAWGEELVAIAEVGVVDGHANMFDLNRYLAVKDMGEAMQK